MATCFCTRGMGGRFCIRGGMAVGMSTRCGVRLRCSGLCLIGVWRSVLLRGALSGLVRGLRLMSEARRYVIPETDRCIVLVADEGEDAMFLSGPNKFPYVTRVVGGRLCFEDGTELVQVPRV